MRDHNSDFNKTVLEVIPASWVIRVDGRPTLKEAEVVEEEKEGEGFFSALVYFV